MRSDDIVQAAREQAQLEHFDSDSFREGLAIAAYAIDSHPLRTQSGKDLLHRMYTGNLVTRLKVADHVRRHPEVAEQTIERPVFIMGMPRTGTTLASYLLGADRTRRSLLRWEVAEPVPPPTTAALYDNPVVAAMYAQDRAMESAGHSFAAIHYDAPDGPTECTFVMAHDFRSLFVESMSAWRAYSDWYLAADLAPAYRYHKLFLQVLQSEAPGNWSLKLPSHGLGIRPLLDLYPDARIIWTHRDPFRAAGSLMSMIAKAQMLSLKKSDIAHVRDIYPAQLREHLVRPMAVMDERGDDVFYHLHYARLVADPLREMRHLYAWLGDDLTPEAEAAMRVWLADNPQGRFGRHAYGLEDFGHSIKTLTPYFEAYLARFDIAMEG